MHIESGVFREVELLNELTSAEHFQCNSVHVFVLSRAHIVERDVVLTLRLSCVDPSFVGLLRCGIASSCRCELFCIDQISDRIASRLEYNMVFRAAFMKMLIFSQELLLISSEVVRTPRKVISSSHEVQKTELVKRR